MKPQHKIFDWSILKTFEDCSISLQLKKILVKWRTAGFASVEELKSYQTKSKSRNRPENKYWFKAALDLRNQLGLHRQLSGIDSNLRR